MQFVENWEVDNEKWADIYYFTREKFDKDTAKHRHLLKFAVWDDAYNREV